MRKLMAMVTEDGVACDETGLCSDCDTPDNRALLQLKTWDEDPGLKWRVRTRDHAISCQICGWGNRNKALAPG